MQIQEPEEQQPDEQGVAIYSKATLLLFSIFFSPLVGSVLLMLNLRSAGYKRQGTIVLFFGIAWQFFCGVVVNYAASLLGFPKNDTKVLQHPQVVILVLILNIIGGGILVEYFFKKYFPFDDYEHKSIWKALLITLVVVIPLSMLIRM
jgi:hypothetical protein